MQWIQKGHEDIMRGETRDSEDKTKPLQRLLNFITSLTENNGEHHMDTDQHNPEETIQEQKETTKPPLNLETAIRGHHLSVLDGKKTTLCCFFSGLAGYFCQPSKYFNVVLRLI